MFALQRKVEDLAFALSFITTECHEQNRLDCFADRNALTYDEQAGHWLAETDPRVSVPDHRVQVLRHDHTTLVCGLLQDDLIGGRSKSAILSANEVEIRLALEQPARDVAVQTRVREEPQHNQRMPRSAARFMRRSRMAARSIRDSLMRKSSSARTCLTRRYSSTSAACRRQYVMAPYVGDGQGVVASRDLVGRVAALEGADDDVEGHASPADARHTVGVD